MMPVFPTVLTLSLFGASWLLTAWMRRQALAHQLLDIPNSRSSHTVATPHGGGVAIALSTLVALLVLGGMDLLAWPSALTLYGGGFLVALIGFVDDRFHVAPRWRLVGHFVAAAWVLERLGGAPTLTGLGFVLNPGWFGLVIAAVYVVWMVNLTNFMDGIDGLAGVEVISVCLGGILLSRIAAPDTQLWIVPLVVASATLGFLVWNWPPAKIFMGDIGSGFLGFMLAAFSLEAGWVAGRLFWCWVILFGVFVVDATVTLLVRVARGEKFYVAHRSHAYQHAALSRGAHLPVTVTVGLINILWLLPVALMVALGWLDGFVGVLIAYSPLGVAAVRLKAGRPFPS